MACTCAGCPGQAERQGGGPLPGPAWVGGAPWEWPAALVTTWRGSEAGHVGGAAAAPMSSLSSRLDGPLPSGMRMEGDTLGFPPLTAEHSGIYVCHVSNDLSWRESQVTVEVLGKPGGPWQRAEGRAEGLG